jgi:hypothetical protein
MKSESSEMEEARLEGFETAMKTEESGTKMNCECEITA